MRAKSKYTQCLAKNAGTGACSNIKYGKFCTLHYNQYYAGIINKKGIKTRDFTNKDYTKIPCIAKNSLVGLCSKYRRGKFCRRHYKLKTLGVIDENGKKLRNFNPGGGPSKKYYCCIVKNSGTRKCSKHTGGRFCQRHKNQFLNGIIDINGNKIRELEDRKKYRDGCILKQLKECSVYKEGRFCTKHKGQYYNKLIDINGNKIRELKRNNNGYDHCSCENNELTPCSKFIIGQNRPQCARHKGQIRAGIIDYNGKILRLLYNGSSIANRDKCHVLGCNIVAGSLGFCRFHYKEIIKLEKFELYPSIIPRSKYDFIKEDIEWYK